MGSKRLHVLILDGDSNAARAVLQSLGRAGHECWVAAPHARGSAFVSRHARRRLVYPDPLRDRDAFLAWLVTLQGSNDVDHVLPVTELSLVPLHEARSSLPDGVAILPPQAALDTVLDKEALRSAAAALGIPTPPSRFLPGGPRAPEVNRDWIAEIERSVRPVVWPAVVKPVRSKLWINGRGTNLHVRLAQNTKELAHHLRYLLPLGAAQIQEWVPGTGVGIEVLAHHGEVVLEFAHERLHEYPLAGGASTYRRTWKPPAPIRDAAVRLLAELGWHGVAMVEFRVDPMTGRFWLMEVNGRFWGSLPLAIFAGVDFPPALLHMWRGDALGTRRPRSTIVSARHITGEVLWCKAVLGSRGDKDRRTPRPSLVRALIEWGRVLGGREIWDGASLSDPLPLLHEIGASFAREVRGGIRRLWRVPRTTTRRRAGRKQLAGAQNVRRVLFVCHGNICRSPYAAAQLAERACGLQLEIRSAGTGAKAGRRTPEMFQRLAAAHGVDLRAHVSRGVDEEILAWADLIVIMDGTNRQALAEVAPGIAAGALLLGALDPRGRADVPDPYLLSAEETALVLDCIDRSVGVLAEAITQGGEHSPESAVTRAP